MKILISYIMDLIPEFFKFSKRSHFQLAIPSFSQMLSIYIPSL